MRWVTVTEPIRTGLKGLVLACCAAVFLFAWQGQSRAEAGFSGMQLQGVDERIAAALGMEEPMGVLVRDVALGEAADLGGIKRGDLIIAYAGTDIASFNQLVGVAQKTKAGQTIDVKVIRAGETVSLEVVLGSKPESWKVTRGEVAAIPGAGLTMAAITPKIRKRFGVRWGATGVLVTLIDAEFADRQILERGDVIVQVNSRDVWKPSQVTKAYQDAKDAKRDRLLLLVERFGNFRMLLMPVRD